MLARAFLPDPAWRWVIPDEQQRGAVLGWLFLKGLEVSSADLWTTEGELLGVSRWVPPGRGAPPIGALLATSLAIPVRFRGSTRRFFGYGRSIGAFRKRLQPGGSWYLDGIGVDPGHQGRGVGGALMWPGLEGADRVHAAVFLLTNEPRNLPFYARFGFDVAGEEETPPGGPVTWAMTRRPR